MNRTTCSTGLVSFLPIVVYCTTLYMYRSQSERCITSSEVQIELSFTSVPLIRIISFFKDHHSI